MRTIHVTGKSDLKIKPDTKRLTIDLSAAYAEYGGTAERALKAAEEIKASSFRDSEKRP